MSITVDQTWVYRFHDTIKLTYQQFDNLLERFLDPGMIHRDVHANLDHHERMGNVLANDVINPFGQVVVLNPAHSRRAVQLVSSDATVLVSDEHTLRAMVNPTSAYTRTIVGALKRRADKHIIDALTGTAQTAAVTTGTGVITYGSQVLPSARKTGTGIALTLANIIFCLIRLRKSAGTGRKIMLYSAGQLTDILAITQASSSDFTRNYIHDKGTIAGHMWEGFEWVEINDVIDIDGSTTLGAMLNITGTTRSCVAFDPSCVGLSIGKDLTTVIDPRPDLQSRPMQVRTSMMQASVRVFEGGVMELLVLEN